MTNADDSLEQEKQSDINELFHAKTEILKQLIEDIHKEIKKRKNLYKGALTEMEEELAKLKILLSDITPLGKYGVSDNNLRNQNTRRIHLEKSISRLNDLKRNHKVETWRDIVSLKKELFKIMPEYVQLLNLKKVIDEDVPE